MTRTRSLMAVRPTRLLGFALGTLAVGYLALCATMFLVQRQLVFPAPTGGRPPRPPAEQIDVPGATPLLWMPPPDDRAPVVVHFHGNAEQISDTQWLGEVFRGARVGFAAVEYPGYGLAAGQAPPTEEKLVTAAQRALSHLTTAMGIDTGRIVLSGQSLGTGVAVVLAERGWGTRLLLVTPYTSLPDVGARSFGFLPVHWLMLDRFESSRRAPGIGLPVLVVHGNADEVIPFDLGQALAGQFPHARFFAVAGGHHHDLWDRAEVRAEAIAFVRGEPATLKER